MDEPDTPKPDPGLNRVLNESLPKPNLPLGFAAAVWRRVRHGDVEIGWREAMRWLLGPRWVLGVLGLALVAGAWRGFTQASADERRAAERRYVMAIDPASAPIAP